MRIGGKNPDVSHDLGTPLWLYRHLDEEFHFTLDPCTGPDNRLGAPRFLTKEDDGLLRNWYSQRAFVNPPYKDKSSWIRKCWQESDLRGTTCVMLIPADTQSVPWHDTVFPAADEIRFIRPRLLFDGGPGFNGRFNSAIVVFRPNMHRHLWVPVDYRELIKAAGKEAREDEDEGDTV